MTGEILQKLLLNFAELSNWFAPLVVILCLICTVIFILRVNTEQGTAKMDVNPGWSIPAQVMKGVANPFMMTLHAEKISSIKDGVWLSMSLKEPCRLQLLWGVSIKYLYSAVHQKWDDFIEAVENNVFLEDHCLHRGEITQLDTCRSREQLFEIADGNSLDLGQPPRAVYPLVVLLTIPSDQISDRNNHVVSMVSIIHLSDDVCPGQSHIISQFIRTVEGQPMNLQQLYVASSELTNDEETSQNEPANQDDASILTSESNGNVDIDDSTENSCVVCQSENIKVVLLPCRHTCVCSGCLVRLDKCPMCRCPIQSYFSLDSEHGSVNHELGSPDQNTSPDWWVRFNQRLNTFLGIT